MSATSCEFNRLDSLVDRQLSGFSSHVSIKRRMLCIEPDQIKRPKISKLLTPALCNYRWSFQTILGGFFATVISGSFG